MILAIRTDGAIAELYLTDQSNKELASKKWTAGHQLSQQILSEILKLVERHKLKLEDLTGVVVFKGPGSFTSLRIGISVANTLAYGLSIAVVGNSGSNWLHNGLKHLAKADLNKYVRPVYGRAPNITRPRK